MAFLGVARGEQQEPSGALAGVFRAGKALKGKLDVRGPALCFQPVSRCLVSVSPSESSPERDSPECDPGTKTPGLANHPPAFMQRDLTI